MPATNLNDRLRRLPKVDAVLARDELSPWQRSPFATDAVRQELAAARETVKTEPNAAVPDAATIAASARARLDQRFASPLRRVLNGTGVIVHTNLGRSPLSKAAIDAMIAVARGYSTLEYDLQKGRRGSRHDLVKEALLALTGAEDALVTNNNASALLLALTALSKRKQVVVSRGQLVEIGGSFRIPDICRVSGATMVEVGTTNRTRIADYAAAITDRTGMLLRVHPSNFRVVGFTEETSLGDLVDLGRERGVPVVDDLGSGALDDLSTTTPLPREPLVRESVEAGADVITFSGDKLLGGPQAGIAVGRSTSIARMRKHPLMRAVRPDKLAFAALDATLSSYLRGEHHAELPVWRMLDASISDLDRWLEPLHRAVLPHAERAGLQVSVIDSEAHAGGGSLPEQVLPSRALAVTGPQRALTRLRDRMRLGDPPLIGYITDGRLLVDARTLLIDDRDEITRVILAALEDIP